MAQSSTHMGWRTHLWVRHTSSAYRTMKPGMMAAHCLVAGGQAGTRQCIQPGASVRLAPLSPPGLSGSAFMHICSRGAWVH